MITSLPLFMSGWSDYRNTAVPPKQSFRQWFESDEAKQLLADARAEASRNGRTGGPVGTDTAGTLGTAADPAHESTDNTSGGSTIVTRSNDTSPGRSADNDLGEADNDER